MTAPARSSLIEQYKSMCNNMGIEPSIDKFNAVERQMRAFVIVCQQEGKITETQCPVALCRIDDKLYYYIKIVTPNVEAAIFTKEDCTIMGYNNIVENL